MDSVLYPARTSKTRNNLKTSSLTKRHQVLKVTAVAYIQGYELRLHFNDGTATAVDFAPFLTDSKNRLIRVYLDIDKFKGYSITNGDLEWNDYDLCFPIIDLYENNLFHSGPKAHEQRVRERPEKYQAPPKRRAANKSARKSRKA